MSDLPASTQDLSEVETLAASPTVLASSAQLTRFGLQIRVCIVLHVIYNVVCCYNESECKINRCSTLCTRKLHLECNLRLCNLYYPWESWQISSSHSPIIVNSNCYFDVLLAYADSAKC